MDEKKEVLVLEKAIVYAKVWVFFFKRMNLAFDVVLIGSHIPKTEPLGIFNSF